MTGSEQRSWRDVDLGGIAVEASYGLMLLRYEGAKSDYLQKIEDGIELLNLLDTGEKIVQQGKASNLSEYDAYLAVEKLLEPRKPFLNPQMSKEELQNNLQKSNEIRNKLRTLLKSPAQFASEEIEECQTFFAELSLKL